MCLMLIFVHTCKQVEYKTASLQFYADIIFCHITPVSAMVCITCNEKYFTEIARIAKTM